MSDGGGDGTSSQETVNITFSAGFSGKTSLLPASFGGLSSIAPNLAGGKAADVVSLGVEVRETPFASGATVLAETALSNTGGVWSGALSGLPTGVNLDFRAVAYNNDFQATSGNPIFSGTATKTLTLAGPNDVNVLMASIDDDIAPAFPKVAVTMPSDFQVDTQGDITFNVTHTVSVDYAITVSAGLLSGPIGGIVASGTGLVTVTYTAPATAGGRSITITMNETGDANNTVAYSFPISVGGTAGGITTTITLGPAITGINILRAQTALQIAVTVDGGTAPLVFAWSGTDSFLGLSGTATSVIISAFDDNKEGDVTLIVTDDNGLVASLNHSIAAGDFPFDLTLQVSAQLTVDSGKSQLESLLTQDPIVFGEMANVAAIFAQALILDFTNPEAIFYAGIMQFIIMLDSDETTAIMAKSGMARVRYEDLECLINDLTCFQSDSGTNFGGIGADLTFADAQSYLSIDFLESLSRSADLLDSLPAGFTSLLNIPDSTGTPQPVEFDFADVKIISASLRAVYVINAIPWIWNYPGVDEFLTANGTRDPIGGGIIDITNLELETELQKTNTGLAGLNQTWVNAVTTAWAKIFDALSSGITSLLAEGKDAQGNDFITTAAEFALFDDREDVDRFNLTVLSTSASSLRDSFKSGSAATTVILYDSVAFITDFGTCDPIAGAVSDTDPLNHSFSGEFSGTPAIDITPDEDLSVLDGTTPESQSTIPTGGLASYIFKFTLSAPANLSIYTRGTDINTNIFIGYDPGGGTLEDWDTDIFRKWFPGPSGLSIAADYFQGSTSLPTTGPIDFYVKVTNLSSSSFTLYVTTDLLDGSYPADAPIFLTGGGGRNFTTKVFKYTEEVAAGNIMQVLGEFGNNVDRTTLMLDDPLTPDNESFLEFDSAKTDYQTEVQRVFPFATVTVTNFDGDSTTENINQDSFSLSPIFAGPGTDDTASFPGPLSFCAPPLGLNIARDYEGGFSID